jgi:cbb3-type cytochrome c oxidase subunit III
MKLLASLLTAALLAAPAIDALAQAHAAAEKPAAAAAEKPAGEAKPAQPAKPDLAQGEAKFTAVCVACHGAGGNSGIPANPKLAQQHPEYIVKQLQDFKSGKRKSAIMKPFASALSEEDMRNIAWFVTSKQVKPGFAKEKELVSLGERIFRGGAADRQIPACAGCHSPNGAGIPAQYPRLGGQHADYTAQQLNLFREGTRLNSPVMTGVAAKLSNKEITAVSDYIAGLR